MKANTRQCELRYADNRWSLSLPLASIEEAAETLARLGKTGSTAVSVQLFSPAENRFIEREVLHIRSGVTESLPSTSVKEKIRQFIDLIMRIPLSRTSKFTLACFAIGIVALPILQLLGGGNRTTLPSRTNVRSAPEIADRPAIFRPNQTIQPTARPVNLRNNIAGTDLTSKFLNKRWSLDCSKREETQFTEKYLMHILDDKQYLLTKVSYKLEGNRLYIDEGNYVSSFVVEQNTMQLVSVSAGGFTTHPKSAKIYNRCEGPFISPQGSDTVPVGNPVLSVLSMALAFNDSQAVQEIIATKPILTANEKALLGNVAKVSPEQVAGPVLEYLNLVAMSMDNYKFNNNPWIQVTSFPEGMQGNYSKSCNLFYTQILPDQIVGYWKGDPPKPWKFNAAFISGSRILLKSDNGGFTVMEHSPQFGIKIVATILPSGAEAPGRYGNWIDRCYN